MQKIYFRRLHQSYFLISLCLGVIVGTILAEALRWNFLASGWWIAVALLLFIFAYFRPTYTFLAVSLVAGMILAFVRVTNYTGNFLETNEAILAVRDWFAMRIGALIPEPESRLGVAYLLGIKDGLSAEFSTALKAVGLAHIVVASGTHLSILVGFARKICGKVSKLFGLVCAILFTLFFMSMVGWTASILRAGMMAILSLLAWFVGRKFAAWRIIIIVMSITLLINPTFLTDLGWILSFASYAGIMILGPAGIRYFYGKEKINPLASIVATTLAATLATTPILLYYFGSISLISIIANLLILPTLPIAMGLTFLTGVVAGIPGISAAAAWVATRILRFHIAVVNFFAEQTYLIVTIPKYNAWIFLLYIPILAPFIWGWIRQRRIKVLKSREV